MTQEFTLEFLEDDGWLVGRLRGVPGVFSQGQTIEELKENIRDVFKLMNEDEEALPAKVVPQRMKIELAV